MKEDPICIRKTQIAQGIFSGWEANAGVTIVARFHTEEEAIQWRSDLKKALESFVPAKGGGIYWADPDRYGYW